MAERATTIRMSSKLEEQLEKLQKRIGAANRTEVYKRALALLDVVSAAEEKGARLYVRTGKAEKEIILL